MTDDDMAQTTEDPLRVSTGGDGFPLMDDADSGTVEVGMGPDTFDPDAADFEAEH